MEGPAANWRGSHPVERGQPRLRFRSGEDGAQCCQTFRLLRKTGKLDFSVKSPDFKI